MALNSMQDLVILKLQALYDAEKQAIEALPQMAEAASSPELKQGLQAHVKETEGQVKRLEQIFEQLGEKPGGEQNKGMQGLIQEGQKMIKQGGEPAVLDAAIIGAAQAVEHYEIAGYGTARALAQGLGMKDAATLLEETLQEEKQNDERLTHVAEQNVNKQAKQASK